MQGEHWQAALWVEQFEDNGGLVVPTGILIPLDCDRAHHRLKTKCMCLELEVAGRLAAVTEFANSPERMKFYETREITVGGRYNLQGERLIAADYLDAMEKYKGKPQPFPPVDMCLELIQRDYFGRLDNQMEFSEVSLAVCLREISDGQTENSIAQYFLNGLANALDSAESPWQLKLSRKKWAGKFKPVSTDEGERALWALAALEHYESDGWPTEAGIAKVAERLGGISRASTFKVVKEGRRLRKLFGEFPIDVEKSTD